MNVDFAEVIRYIGEGGDRKDPFTDRVTELSKKALLVHNFGFFKCLKRTHMTTNCPRILRFARPAARKLEYQKKNVNENANETYNVFGKLFFQLGETKFG